MDDQMIDAVVAEIRPLIIGRAPGKIFQLSSVSMVIDFRLREHGDLFISVEPGQPRMYLIRRRVRDLEKQSMPFNQFAQALKKDLSDTSLLTIEKDSGDRIVWFHFAGTDELGHLKERAMIAQLTGRAANLFLVDRQGVIINQARAGIGPGQMIGETYQRPPAMAQRKSAAKDPKLTRMIRSGEFASLSAAADAYFTSLQVEQDFDSRAGAARGELQKKIRQQEKLIRQLEHDLSTHAEAEHHKRLGDLLLANLTTAQRVGKRVTLIDYFAADAGPIEIDLDEQTTLPEEASRRFALYSRSKRAVTQITNRLDSIRTQLNLLNSRLESLEKIVAARDETALQKFTAAAQPRLPRATASGSRSKSEKKIPGVRRYISSDGFEILVGRAAHDNDHLTFKVAKPNDLWLHAADYGGSHVVVRNATRKNVPHRTIIEAAQLAAHFSQARKDPKVDVHYTERKFVSKSKGAVAGLVRMTRFKNILVEPKEAAERV
jgi:predicted ribosome quality control (RQC) complex YloA/Tae2 family protein